MSQYKYDSYNKMSQKFNQKYIKSRIIGTGSISSVCVVTTKSIPKQSYALKAVNKEEAARLKQITYVRNEKNLLMSFNCPFIVKL